MCWVCESDKSICDDAVRLFERRADRASIESDIESSLWGIRNRLTDQIMEARELAAFLRSEGIVVREGDAR